MRKLFLITFMALLMLGSVSAAFPSIGWETYDDMSSDNLDELWIYESEGAVTPWYHDSYMYSMEVGDDSGDDASIQMPVDTSKVIRGVHWEFNGMDTYGENEDTFCIGENPTEDGKVEDGLCFRDKFDYAQSKNFDIIEYDDGTPLTIATGQGDRTYDNTVDIRLFINGSTLHVYSESNDAPDEDFTYTIGYTPNEDTTTMAYFTEESTYDNEVGVSLLRINYTDTSFLPFTSGVNEMAYWNLPSMADQTGNDHDLSNHGAPTATIHPPRSGSPQSTFFDGTTYVSSDDSLDTIIDMSENWTINLWSYGSESVGTTGSYFYAEDDTGDTYMLAQSSDTGKRMTVTLYDYVGNDLLWNYNLAGETFSSIAPVHNDVLDADDDYSYVGVSSSSAQLLMVDSSGNPVWNLSGFIGGINDIATADTSAGVVYLGDDQKVYKVHPNGTSVYWSGTNEGPVHAIETYGGTYVFAGRENTQVYKYDSNGNFYWNNSAHDGPVLDITTDGLYVYSVGEDDTVRKYGFTDGNLVDTISNASDDTTGIVVRNDIYVSSLDGYVRSYDSDGNLEWSYDTGSPVNTLATDGNWLYAGKDNGEIDKLSMQGTHIWTDPNRFSSVIDDMEFNDKIYAVTPSYAYAIQENQTSAQVYGDGLVAGNWNMWSITRNDDNISLYANTLLRDSTTFDSPLELNGSFYLGRGLSYYKGFLDEIRLYNVTLPQGNIESVFWFADPNVNVSEYLRVSASDALSDETIYGLTVEESGFTYEVTGLPYLIVDGIIKDLETDVDLTVSASAYADRTYEAYDPSTSGDLEAELYPGNSLYLTAYNLSDGSVVNDFGAVVYEGDFESGDPGLFVDSTTTGELYFSGLVADDYVVNVVPTSDSFEDVFIEFEVETGEMTSIPVYFSTGTLYDAEVSVWFENGGGPEPEILVRQYARLNDTWVLVDERRTSSGVVVSGADFKISPDTSYMFVAVEPGYYDKARIIPSSDIDGDKTFTLTMERRPVSPVSDEVSVGVSDYHFRVNETSWAVVDIVGLEGTLEGYNASLSVGDCSFTDTVQTGSTADGGVFNLTCSQADMENATQGSTATVKVCYVTEDDDGCVTKQFPVKMEADVGGLDGLRDASAGWGGLEKALLATLLIMFIGGGLGAGTKSPVLGGIGVMLSAGVCTYALGWLNPWIFYLVALPVGLLIMTALGGGHND